MFRKIQRVRSPPSNTLCCSWSAKVCICEKLHHNTELCATNLTVIDCFGYENSEKRMKTLWGNLIRKYNMVETHDMSFSSKTGRENLKETIWVYT